MSNTIRYYEIFRLPSSGSNILRLSNSYAILLSLMPFELDMSYRRLTVTNAARLNTNGINAKAIYHVEGLVSLN